MLSFWIKSFLHNGSSMTSDSHPGAMPSPGRSRGPRPECLYGPTLVPVLCGAIYCCFPTVRSSAVSLLPARWYLSPHSSACLIIGLDLRAAAKLLRTAIRKVPSHPTLLQLLALVPSYHPRMWNLSVCVSEGIL